MYNSSKSKQPFQPQRNQERSPFDRFSAVIGWIVFFGLALLFILLILEGQGVLF